MGSVFCCQNFITEDDRDIRRCTATKHWYEKRKCMNEDCNGGGTNRRTICANDLCSFSSKRVKGVFLCRTCFNNERILTEYVEIKGFDENEKELEEEEQEHGAVAA